MRNWRANSPLWPVIDYFEDAVRGRIYVSSRTSPPKNGVLANPGGVHIRSYTRRLYIRLAKGQELIQGCRPEIGLYDVNALEADLTKQGTAETEVIVFKRYF
jgi:hypothetical protein